MCGCERHHNTGAACTCACTHGWFASPKTRVLPDKWSATVSLEVGAPQLKQYGTVQLNARRGASQELVSCDIDAADFAAAFTEATGFIVIDPEDFEQVARIYPPNWVNDNGQVEWLQNHIRSLVSSKLEEPTGRYAVVRDRAGDEWIKDGLLRDAACTGAWWNVHRAMRMDYDTWRADWADVDVVEVLFEGVTE